MFLEFLTIACTSSTQDCSDGERGEERRRASRREREEINKK
jgi:hypothetical protein